MERAMTTIKQLLLKQTADAYDGRADMSLMASLRGITAAEAGWRPGEGTPTVEQLVRHVAWAKSQYCHEGFGRPMALDDGYVDANGDCAGLPWEFPCGAGWGSRVAGGIGPAVELLGQAHRGLVECLESLPEDALDGPIPTRHGSSAANLFWVLLMHDLYHAGQIRTRRTLCPGKISL
jgi:hypothetical protein